MNEASRFRDLVTKNILGICDLSEAQIRLLYSHYELMSRWNKVLNLTGIRDLETVVIRHYCESVFVGVSLPERGVSVADFGSGAGFPGIPVAVVRPDCPITLIESHQRKAVFLKESTRGYPNVTVTARRAQDLDESFDWVVSRAVRWQDILRVVPELAQSIGLLTAVEEADKLMKIKKIAWKPAIHLPWGHRRILLIGTSNVPRGT
jgi:16S rRNA (guanine527-N7)-methyltransferase